MKEKQVFFGHPLSSKYFYDGDDFASCLLRTLRDAERSGGKEKYAVLTEAIKTSIDLHPEDVLMEIFSRKLDMDFEFARRLRLFDIVGSHCFTSDTATGKAMIDLVFEFSFIVERRFWSRPDSLSIDFRVSDRSDDCYLLRDMIRGNLTEF